MTYRRGNVNLYIAANSTVLKFTARDRVVGLFMEERVDLSDGPPKGGVNSRRRNLGVEEMERQRGRQRKEVRVRENI